MSGLPVWLGKWSEHYALNRSVYVNNITVYRGIKWCAPSVSTGGPSAHAFHCNFHMVGMWRNWIGKQMEWFSCAQGITACPVLADSWFGMPSICWFMTTAYRHSGSNFRRPSIVTSIGCSKFVAYCLFCCICALEVRVGGTEWEHSLSKSKVKTWVSMVTTWTGDH